MKTKSRPCKGISSLGQLCDTTLPIQVAENMVGSAASSCGEGLAVSSCYGEGVTHAMEKGSSSLKWKGSFVKGLDVAVCGEISGLGGCDIRPSKRVVVDEGFSRLGVGVLHVSDETHMYVGEGLRCDKGVVVGSSAADISVGRLPISDSSNKPINVLKRKALCVEEPLLQTDMKRRRDDVGTVAHTAVFTKPVVLDFQSQLVLPVADTDANHPVTNVGANGCKSLLCEGESVTNADATTFLHHLSGSVLHNVTHTGVLLL